MDGERSIVSLSGDLGKGQGRGDWSVLTQGRVRVGGVRGAWNNVGGEPVGLG